MTPEEKKTLLREKLGITGEPLGPDDFDPTGTYLLPRRLRKKPVTFNEDGSVLLSAATFAHVKALIVKHTGEDGEPALGFLALAQTLGLDHLIPEPLGSK